MAATAIVDAAGRPMISADAYRSVHGGADRLDPDLFSWNPALQSPDVEILPEWGTMVARTRDMVRNHGIASGAVQTHLDNVIGTGLRLSAKPDWRALGLSPEWADEWSRNVESLWRQFADDIDYNCDYSRRLNFAGLLGQGYRSYLVSSEMLCTLEWRRRPGIRYATCVQMVQPDRLSNPMGVSNGPMLRSGVRTDDTGEALGYHIRNSHPSDGALAGLGVAQWKYVPAFTPWGRRRVVHIFDAEQPGQNRGKTGFASVLAKMRVMDRFEKATLQAAIINAMYAAVIESDLGTAEVAGALGDNAKNPLDGYMKAKAAFAREAGNVHFDGARVTHLLPGEKFNLLSPEHPSAAFAEFESATLRHIAAGLNLSYEQLSRDYSKTNYSSARASLLEAWRFFMGRRQQVAGRFAAQVYAAWLEEAISLGDVEVPAGAPSYYQAKTAWCRAEWIGAPKGHVDELKEMQARKVQYHDLWTTTLEKLCAEQGLDWEEVLEQRARELRRMKDLQLDPSTMNATSTRTTTPTEREIATEEAAA
jgi:lambda family phage portal protein